MEEGVNSCKFAKSKNMTTIKNNISLKGYNTFGIDIRAKHLCFYNKPADLKYLITEGPLSRDEKMIILGGGSNQLFTKDFDGIVIHPVNNSIELIRETDEYVFIKVGAGKNWDEFVEYSVNNGYGGIENLSDIPGNVGASPVQNIGAYGMEAKDTIHEVHLVSFHDGSTKTIQNKDCEFVYRSSVFKSKLKNRFLVDSVTFKLSKNPTFITHYGSLQDELNKEEEISLKTIRKTIIKIRESKLPSPTKIGNGGSFFKNPIIPNIHAEPLKAIFTDMVTYPAANDMTKIAAGWLIDQCGLKGYTNEKGTAGIHDKQALVLVNKGKATGSDIVELAEFVKAKVFEKFDICLEPEVIII